MQDLSGPQESSGTSGSSWRSPGRSLWRPAFIVVGYLLSWFALNVATEHLRGELEVSLWYPPSGLSFALLLIFGVRYAPAMVLTTLAQYLLHRGGTEYPVWLLLSLPVAYTAVYVGAAMLLMNAIKIDPRLLRLRDILYFVGIGCLVAPFVASMVAVAGYAAGGQVPPNEFVINVLGGGAGEATGVGVLTTLLFIGLRPFPSLWSFGPDEPAEGFSLPARREIPEIVGQTVVLAAALFVAYGTNRGVRLDFAYLVFLPLIWVALRSDLSRTMLCVLIINVGAVLLVGGAVENTNPILIQFGLTTLTLVGVLLGGLLTERRETSERLAREASRDRLTGLYNRPSFSPLLSKTATRRSGKGFMVLAVDLDRFADINNALGHRIGDRLLIAVGERLEAFVPKRSDEEPNEHATEYSAQEQTARIGGDVFALLVDRIGSSEEAERETRRLLTELARPYEICGGEVYTTASAGVVVETESGIKDRDMEDLLRDADIALQTAKSQGYSRCAIFDRLMGEAANRRLTLSVDLRRAIERNELTLHYQPIFSFSTDEVVGAEALVRWEHPEKGLLSPEEFIPLAEQGGQIVPVGEWVLKEACSWAKQWQEKHPSMPFVTISVNLSPKQLERPGLSGEVAAILKETGLAPGLLVLEVTESAVVTGAGRTLDTLKNIRKLGVRLAVDDFGTGYSSLSYLNRFPLDIVKLDRSFIGRLSQENPSQESSADERLVSGAVDLAHSQNLAVVAEGVENAIQLVRLRELGCDMVQGYCLAEPLPHETAWAFMENNLK